MNSPFNCKVLHENLGVPALLEEAIRRGEGQLAATGAFAVKTGQHTGRSPADKFVVRDLTTELDVWWDNTKPIAREAFDRLQADMLLHARGLEIFAQELYAGADPAERIGVKVYCEFAWHAQFIRTLLIRPKASDLANFATDLTIIDLPSFKADPARHGTRSETVIALDLTRKLVLIGGTSYAGEIKKSVFSFLNFTLPERDVMPMHCSANEGAAGDAALFFGLSGTGKTTLSADPKRALIGDDEHGWSRNGVFNFEGGCYAKTIKLSKTAEPEIYSAVNRFGAVLENVVIDPETRLPDFDSAALAENARGAYPTDFISNAKPSCQTGHPRTIIMLTADAFGVLPPIAKLTPSQAMYHFLSGYTAKVAGTEKGVTEPSATFSTCFGAPFMPRHPSVYGNLLRRKIADHKVSCWLVNTGWTGGKYGDGRRMPIGATRALVNAALTAALDNVPMRRDPVFQFEVPLAVAGVETKILEPRSTWACAQAYDRQAAMLAGLFVKNFAKFERYVDAEVLAAAPRQLALAE